MPAMILRTSVSPDGEDDRVQLEISDAPLQVETASMEGSIRMSVEVKIPAYKAPLIEHIQIEVIDETINALRIIKHGLEGSSLKGVGKSEFGGGLAIARKGSRLA